VQPLLDPDIPTTPEALNALRDRNPYAHAVIRPLFELHHRIMQTGDRSLVAQYFERSFGVTHDADVAIQDAIASAQHLLTHPELHGMTPPIFRNTLWPKDVLHRVPSTIADLLPVVFGKASNQADRLRTFEARRLLTLVLFCTRLQRSIASPDRSQDTLVHVRGLLEEQLLIPGKVEERILYTNHDPANADRCATARFDEQPQWGERSRDTPIAVRFFRDASGQEHPVIVRLRVKDAFGILRRMLRDHLPFPEYVLDLRGVRFICFSHEDRRALLDQLTAKFPRVATTIGDWVDRYSETAVRGLNRFSSSYFRAQKFSCEFSEHSRMWEVQVMHVHDYANLWYSLGRENWYQYHLRQLFALVFPQLFPTAIYGVSWTRRSPATRHFLSWVQNEWRKSPDT
jgi:hypothetical protein